MSVAASVAASTYMHGHWRRISDDICRASRPWSFPTWRQRRRSGVQYLIQFRGQMTAVATSNPCSSEPPMSVYVAYLRTKFRWIGSLLRGNTVCGVWHTSSIKSIDDARQREITLSATGATSGPTRASLLLSRIGRHEIPTYRWISSKFMGLAVERREVEGSCKSLSSLRTSQLRRGCVIERFGYCCKSPSSPTRSIRTCRASSTRSNHQPPPTTRFLLVALRVQQSVHVAAGHA